MHRGQPVAPISCIRDIAQENGTTIFDPEDVNAPESVARLKEFEADLLIACDYGQILSMASLATARLGGINLHAALLPKYRGAAPINWAIYNGETETGVTVIHMTPKIDAGPCIAQKRTPIGPDETAGELEVRLAELGTSLVCESIDMLEAHREEPLPQDVSLACKAPRLKKTDGLLCWTRAATELRNHIRSMDLWPKTYTFWHSAKGSPIRVIVCSATAIDSPSLNAAPGTVLEAAGDHLIIATGKGALQIHRLQPSGKRTMEIAEFLRGHRIEVGDCFGDE
jgi:methionyl-tRNA formyltransferase